jgi:hypothetical protein
MYSYERASRSFVVIDRQLVALHSDYDSLEVGG